MTKNEKILIELLLQSFGLMRPHSGTDCDNIEKFKRKVNKFIETID